MTYEDILKEEAEELRKRGKQFINEEITRGDLKSFSGGLGCYSQKEVGKFMIRLRTPSGILSKDHLKLIISYADQYKLDKIHLTTRQAVQLHDLTIDEVCDTMKDAIDHKLFTRGGGGNFPRNVSLSPMAGVDPGEAFDVTPYAIQVGQYFLERATTYKLPRKLKVAFSSSMEDTGCATINDLGFVAAMENGQPCFRMFLAGGMGGSPAVAIPYPKRIAPSEVLYYVEAMVHLFEAEGDYTNKAKARTRFIPRRMGVEAFLECYEKHLYEVAQKECFLGYKAVPSITEEWVPEISIPYVVYPQRQKDRYTVVLHPVCGQLGIEEARILSQFTEGIPDAQMRLSMNEDIFVRNLTKLEVEEFLSLTKNFNKTKLAGKTISCIGTPACQMGVLMSQKLTHAVIDALEEAELDDSILPLIQINGCPNSCSRHPIAAIGFAGRRKKVDGVSLGCFDLYVGGKVGEGAKLAEHIGTIAATEIPSYLVEIARTMKEQALAFEAFYKTEQFSSITEKYLV